MNDKYRIQNNFERIAEIPTRLYTFKIDEIDEVLVYMENELSKLTAEAARTALDNPHQARGNISAFDWIYNHMNRGYFSVSKYNELKPLLTTQRTKLFAELSKPAPTEPGPTTIDFIGLSKFLLEICKVQVNAESLEYTHKYEKLPDNMEKPHWPHGYNEAEIFRGLMWPGKNRAVFNRCFKFGKNGVLKFQKPRNNSEHDNKLKSFFF